MIGRLRGTLVGRTAEGVVLDVNGVGYEIAVTPRALADLPVLGEEAVLHTHLHVREDQLALFGFPSEGERGLFRTLLGASGVGPKLALAILGTLSVDELRLAVLGQDTAALELVPGIGKRSAQKLILELRPKLDLPDGDLPSAAGGPVAEVREALESLGYQPTEIREVLAGMSGDSPVEEMLRAALQELGRS
jgi:Holliday junction DNA helicase RuvA